MNLFYSVTKPQFISPRSWLWIFGLFTVLGFWPVVPLLRYISVVYRAFMLHTAYTAHFIKKAHTNFSPSSLETY